MTHGLLTRTGTVCIWQNESFDQPLEIAATGYLSEQMLNDRFRLRNLYGLQVEKYIYDGPVKLTANRLSENAIIDRSHFGNLIDSNDG